MKPVCLLFVLIGLVFGAPSNSPRDYVGSQVLTVIPRHISQVNYLIGLYKSDMYDFWKLPARLGQKVDIMATRWMLPVLKKTLDQLEMEYSTKIFDLYSLMNTNKAQNDANREKALRQGKAMEWTAYHTPQEINDWMDELAATYPELVTVTDVGTSFEGRTMKKLVVSSGGSGKPVIFSDAGIHAREWIAPATLTFMMNELITNSAAYQDSIDAVDFVFMPCINPDGYQYSIDEDRFWRKTRSVTSGNLCIGADANRNWDYYFGGEGTSANSCSDVYTGPNAFSEPETQIVSEQIQQYSENGIMYLTYHSALEQFLRPYGYEVNVPADNEADHIVICEDAIAALYEVHGIQYECILSGELYAAAGASDDWSKGVADYVYTFTIELRDQGYGFDLPADQIIPSGEETFAAFRSFFEYVRDNPQG